MQRRSPRIFVLPKPATRIFCIAAAVYLFFGACAPFDRNTPFDPKTCLETVPRRVEGLKILQGPRSEQSIIRDMVPAVCSGRALFRHMQSQGDPIAPGRVVFRVRVEWTGEVYDVAVADTTIQSKPFLRKVSDFIMDSDFVFWARHDTDTVFLYPVRFGF